jgi:hypothetical protein
MMDDVMEWLTEWVMVPLMILCMAGMGIAAVVGIPYGIYYWLTYEPAKTFELRIDSWDCTRSEVRTRTEYVLVGKITVPHTVEYNHCTQWNER